MPISVVILAAGHGKRMNSQFPKVLHRLAGKPLLEHIVNTAQQLDCKDIFVVVGHESRRIQQELAHLPVQWVEQQKRLGTGHAVLQVLPQIDPSDQVLTLVGDIPLVTLATLQRLVAKTNHGGVGLVTAKLADPSGLGRIIRDDDNDIIAIVEDRDTSVEQRQIKEINTGIITAPAKLLNQWLPAISNHNSQGEYYLTDIISAAVTQNEPIHGVIADHQYEAMGVNDRCQLAKLERIYQYHLAQEWMRRGVTIIDPSRLDIRGEVEIGIDTIIDINVVLEGNVKIGKNCQIGPNCLLRNVTLADDVTVNANSVLEASTVANNCIVGPFARLRPGTELANDVHIGNFVEVKKSIVAEHSKINHLSYVGDTDVGKSVNIGAGTITCNYDGFNKYRTQVGDHAFIGSGAQLVAPVNIGAWATIGAGSTITENAPENTLTLGRARQCSITDWKRPDQRDSNKE